MMNSPPIFSCVLVCISVYMLAGCAGPRADQDLDAGMVSDADASAVTTAVRTFVYEAEINAAGLGPRMQFEVPEGAVSVQVQVRGEPRMVMAVDLLEAPDGSRLVDPDLPGYVPTSTDRALLYFPAAFHSPNRSVWGTEHAVLLAPDTPGVSLQPGVWVARVAVVDGADRPMAGAVEAEVLVKTTTERTEWAQLTVNLHFASDRWEARTADEDPAFRTVLRSIAAAFARVQIRVRFGTRTQLPFALKSPAGRAALRAVFKAGVEHAGLNLFFLNHIDAAGDGSALAGLSGNVPGPNGWNGASVAGVLVATSFSEDPAELALVATHEMGHYLGLFHTVELAGDYQDQLDDTSGLPSGPGNLMYPSDTDEETRFSPDQGWVMRRSPSVEGILGR